MGDIEAGTPEETQEQPDVETPETPESPEETPEETPEGEAEAKEGESDEDKPDETKPDPAAAAAEEKERRRRSGYQRQQSKIEWQERRIAELEAASRRPREPEQPKPAPKGDEQIQEYIRSQAREEAKKLLAEERAQAERERQQSELKQQWDAEHAALAKEVPDLDEVMEEAKYLPMSDNLREVMLTSPKLPRLIEQLARNPDELARLNALPLVQAAREIARLEAKFAVGAAPAQKLKPALRPPAPPTSVGGSKSSSRSEDSLSIADYKRAMRSKGR